MAQFVAFSDKKTLIAVCIPHQFPAAGRRSTIKVIAYAAYYSLSFTACVGWPLESQPFAA